MDLVFEIFHFHTIIFLFFLLILLLHSVDGLFFFFLIWIPILQSFPFEKFAIRFLHIFLGDVCPFFIHHHLWMPVFNAWKLPPFDDDDYFFANFFILLPYLK